MAQRIATERGDDQEREVTQQLRAHHIAIFMQSLPRNRKISDYTVVDVVSRFMSVSVFSAWKEGSTRL